MADPTLAEQLLEGGERTRIDVEFARQLLTPPRGDVGKVGLELAGDFHDQFAEVVFQRNNGSRHFYSMAHSIGMHLRRVKRLTHSPLAASL